MKKYLYGVCIFFIIGCATQPQNAEKVTVLRGDNAYTASCEMLGKVQNVVNPWGFGSESEAAKQALWNMQAEAYEKYGADTLSIQFMGTSMTEVGGYGVALKCFNK
ncbi:hypothetical protein [Wohlfahrtiimonas chitiniclastica]|uniref:hypothetical protein n=1 Tax=Wohlfahrtiimonas chitiniclastica TaxID=400946 RepID=UPI000B994C19|nr:hypothetical protein [Wohlfahrtiimonas chitiniclastica]MBS7821602.1 hypothetical protein [Wohlfahrtiimonas chitiniclastica]MBS7835265.1 hypothetical protein [Wohlfahrtiimonas chitiniclastica]OYQ82394.1 hypothetical protein B9T14_10035 [Wohlfahrtiimonas chitiniclastica]OYQ83428.1 hypothetical protein B9T15_10065 [Wohlfahrtiimonas chitiniclastica]